MSAKKFRVPVVVLFALSATASWLRVTAAPPQTATLLPLAAPAVASCQVGRAASLGGNCDDDSDCPGGYCYHDPIALVPYCVGGGSTLEPQQP